ncbi:MAG: hypothetical protein CMQ13_04060 [Gammaproteobacteria bacterium]|nr:hypothetical protein [Gammaproteobacteria bacterium]
MNSAKDDAAGLRITSEMTAQVNGLNQAVGNFNDAIGSRLENALNKHQYISSTIQAAGVRFIDADHGFGATKFARNF